MLLPVTRRRPVTRRCAICSTARRSARYWPATAGRPTGATRSCCAPATTRTRSTGTGASPAQPETSPPGSSRSSAPARSPPSTPCRTWSSSWPGPRRGSSRRSWPRTSARRRGSSKGPSWTPSGAATWTASRSATASGPSPRGTSSTTGASAARAGRGCRTQTPTGPAGGTGATGRISDERGPLVSYKMIFCLRRHPDLDQAEFSRYWREEHAELFRRYAETLRVRRYTQSHRLPTRTNDALRRFRGAPDGYDGVAEVWFDSLDDLLGALDSPSGRAAAADLLADERTFIDHSRSPIWIAEEAEIDLP